MKQPLLFAVDQQLGRAFCMDVARREIEQIADLETAKTAALLLLQQIRVQREMADVLIQMDWEIRPAA